MSSCSPVFRPRVRYGSRVVPGRVGLVTGLTVMAWILVLSGTFPSYAGWFPDPKTGLLVMNSGSYSVDGEEVRITVEITRVKGWDGPAHAQVAAPGCTILSEQGKKAVEGTAEVKWANADHKTKTLVLVVPREEFFAVTQRIEVALSNPKGARLGETTSLVAIPKGGDVEAEEGIRVADGKGKLLLLQVEETAPLLPGHVPERTVADASVPNEELPAL